MRLRYAGVLVELGDDNKPERSYLVDPSDQHDAVRRPAGRRGKAVEVLTDRCGQARRQAMLRPTIG